MRYLRFITLLLFALALTACGQSDKPVRRTSILYNPFFYHAPANRIDGNPKGNITIVEFMDYNCDNCKKTYPALRALINIDPNIRVIYKDWPILGDSSVFAAKAVLAAAYQNKYLILHNALMQYPSALTENVILDIAKKNGLNLSQLERDMQRPAINQELVMNYKVAELLKLGGTPDFLIAQTQIKNGNITVRNPQMIIGRQTLQNFKNIIVQYTLAG